jgi:phenylacetate-CoA ligase
MVARFVPTMMSWMGELASRWLFYPLWDVYDGSVKLPELRRLEGSQWRSDADHLVWQRLKGIVEYAGRNCEFYAARGIDNLHSLEEFRAIPVLPKDDVRSEKERLISRAMERERLVRATTGGSTGTALEVFFDEACQLKRNAATMRSDLWSGWKPGAWRGGLWGNPPENRTLKAKVRSRLLDRIVYLDTMRMNEESMEGFLAEVERRSVRFLFGHSHSLFVLARYCEAVGRALPVRLQGIVSTSMMLLEPERRLIERVFRCPVTNRYGCEEVGVIASECERHDGLHINSDHVYVEFLLQDGSPAAPDEDARVVVTDLINLGMPLIRYDTGDIARYSSQSCPCGRTSPLLRSITGRRADFLVRSDRALVAGVSLVERTLTAIPGIAQMQIVQPRLGFVDVNLVPGPDYGPRTETQLVNRLREAFEEDLQVSVRTMTGLPQEQNGKYRFAICRVPNVYDFEAKARSWSDPQEGVTRLTG